jgi:hypothetical protein
MHYRHLISVQALTETEALELVESAMDPYGMGDVWDYYVIGGRWEGYFGLQKNTLRYSEDPRRFLSELEEIKTSYNEAAKDACSLLLDSGALNKILEGEDFSELAEYGAEDQAIKSFCRSLSKRYSVSSGFYDYTKRVAGNPTYLIDRVSLDVGENEWLVVIDIHY